VGGSQKIKSQIVENAGNITSTGGEKSSAKDKKHLVRAKEK
jgi:hypothetical protein